MQVRRGIHTTTVLREEEKKPSQTIDDIMASFLKDGPDSKPGAKKASDFATDLDNWSDLSADEPTKQIKTPKGSKAKAARKSKHKKSPSGVPSQKQPEEEEKAPFDLDAAMQEAYKANMAKNKDKGPHPTDKPMDFKPLQKELEKMGFDTTPVEETAVHQTDTELRYYKGKKPDTVSLLDQMMPETEDPEEGLFDKYFDNDDNSPTGLHDLKLWDLYPKQVKRWMIYTKTPLGIYDMNGLWSSSVAEKTPKYTKPEEKALHYFDSLEDETGHLTKMEEFKSIPMNDEGLLSNKVLNKVFEEEQRALPPDLRSRFRFGVTWDELKDIHPKIKRLFSMKNATPGEISEARKRDLIERYGRWPADTGYPPVQVATFTYKINKLEEHLEANRQDKDNKYRLMRMKIRRKGMLRYLKNKDPAMYYRLLQELSLKDEVKCWKYYTIG